MGRIDWCEGDAEEDDGEAGDAGLEGDVEAGLYFGEAGSVGCYAEGTGVRMSVCCHGGVFEGESYTTKANANATDETYILRMSGQFIGLSGSIGLRLWPDNGLPLDMSFVMGLEEAME